MKEIKRYLKTIDESSLRKLCGLAILTSEETEILVLSLSRRLDLDFIADQFNMSTSTLRRRKESALEKLRFRLRLKDEHSSREIRLRVEQTLSF